MEEMKYKIVTVKHPNCSISYTFQVPDEMNLEPGNYVLCDTKTHKVPQVAKCMTPSFHILGVRLTELYGINPKNLRPIVGILKPVMYAVQRNDADED